MKRNGVALVYVWAFEQNKKDIQNKEEKIIGNAAGSSVNGKCVILSRILILRFVQLIVENFIR